MFRRELHALVLALAAVSQSATVWAQTPTPPPADAAVDPRLAQPLHLEDCIDIALQNNLDLRLARLSEAATRTTITEARGAFWPVVGLTYDRLRNHLHGEHPDKTEHFDNGFASVSQLLPLGTQAAFTYGALHYRLDPDLSDRPANQWTFSLTQPLLRGGWWRTTTAGVRGAGYDTRISESNLEATRLAVVQQVKTAYYEVLRQLKLVEVSAKAIERDDQLVLESRSKLDAGLGTKRDVLSAEIQLEQDRGKLVDAQTAYNEALDGLARVLGLQVEAQRIDIADSEVPLDSVEIRENEWVAKALRDNPALRAARMAVERTRLDMQVAGNGRLPQLDLSLIYNSLDDPDLNELIKEENRFRILVGKEPKELEFTASEGWQALFTFSYPIGNRTLGAAYERTRLLHQQSQRAFEDTQRQVALDVRTAIRSLRNRVEQVHILQKSMDGAKNKLEFASVNFQLGRASNLDITDAQKDLLDAQIDFVNAVIDYQVQLATIEAIVGGFE